MRETPNLLLKLPEENDFVQVEDLNENFTKLDDEIAQITDLDTGLLGRFNKHLDELKTQITSYKTTAQSIAHGTENTVFFQSIGTNNYIELQDGLVKFKQAGVYEIILNISFAQNANGGRIIDVDFAYNSSVGMSDITTRLTVMNTISVPVGHTLRIKAIQTSGGALDVLGDNETFIKIRKVADL